MPKLIERRFSDKDKQLAGIIARKIRFLVDQYQIDNNTTREFVAKKVWISQGRLSQLLWSGATDDYMMYKKIAHAIWLSDRQFDDIVAQAKREVFGGVESTIDVALSHALGGKEEAVKEALQHLEYLRAKYK